MSACCPQRACFNKVEHPCPVLVLAPRIGAQKKISWLNSNPVVFGINVMQELHSKAISSGLILNLGDR